MSINETAMKVVEISVDELTPNAWNSNQVSATNMAKLKKSIEKHGIYKPIIVRELTNGKLEVIGGYHRLQASKELGYTKAPVVNMGKISVKRAKEISLIDNANFGKDDKAKLKDILIDIDMTELEKVMPTTLDLKEIEKELHQNKIALDELENEVLLDDEEKAINLDDVKEKTHQIMRFKIEKKDFEKIKRMLDDTCKAEGFTEADALTNYGDAVTHLLLKGVK